MRRFPRPRSASSACDAALQQKAEAAAARARRIGGVPPLLRRATARRSHREAPTTPAQVPSGPRGRGADAPGFPAAPGQKREGGGAVVHTIELSDEELRLLQAALHSYLDDFGHEEAEVLRRVKALIARLPQPA